MKKTFEIRKLKIILFFCAIINLMITNYIIAADKQYSIDEQKIIKEIITNLKNKQLDKAIELFEESKIQLLNEYEVLLIARAYINLENYEAAINLLEDYRTKFFENSARFENFYKKIQTDYEQKKHSETIRKIKEYFDKAENLFNAQHYQNADSFYSAILNLSNDVNNNLYEITKSQERHIEIQKLVKTENFKKLLENISDEKNNDEKLKSIIDFYDNYYDIADKLQKDYFKNLLISIIKTYYELSDFAKIYEFVNKNKIPLTDKIIFITEICIRLIELDKNSNAEYEQYFNALKQYQNSNDNIIKSTAITEIQRLEKTLNKFKRNIIFNIILIVLAIIIVVSIFIFRKKILILFLELRARYYESIDDRFKLIELYPHLLKYKSNDDNLRIKTVNLFLTLKKNDSEILNVFEGIEKLEFLNFQQLVLILKIFLKQNNLAKFKEIKKKYEIAKELTLDETAELLSLEINYLYSKNQKKEAAILCEEYLQNKFDIEIMKLCISIYADFNDADKTNNYLRQWFKIQPNAIRRIAEFTEQQLKKFEILPPRIYDFLGILYRKLELTDKAIAVYEQILDKHTNKLPIYSALYELYLKKENLPGAIRALEQITQLRTDNIEDKITLAQLYFKTKDYSNAVQLIASFIEKEPNNLRIIEILHNIGVDYDKQNDYENAVKVFQLILQNSNIDITNTRLELGNIFLKMQQPDNAIAVLQKITSGDKANIFKMQILISRALIMKNDFRLAAEILQNIDENDVFINIETKKYICYNKAICYENIGDIERAKKYYQQVILLDITYRDANERYQKIMEEKNV